MKRTLTQALAVVALGAFGLLSVQCTSAGTGSPAAPAKAAAPGAGADPAVLAAWSVIYGVLENPRCMNCHPSGDAPLQGDDSHPHTMLVQRGVAGHGVFGMHCDTCHQTTNLDAPHLPPGAPGWKLPAPAMPLVFQGRSSGELCRQLRDPKQNGGRTPEQLFEHMAKDPLVLWGWNPGPGRTPVSTPHDDLVRALRTWVDGGCGCPP